MTKRTSRISLPLLIILFLLGTLPGCRAGLAEIAGLGKVEYYYNNGTKIPYRPYPYWVGISLYPTEHSDSATVAEIIEGMELRIVSAVEILDAGATRYNEGDTLLKPHSARSQDRTLAENGFWVLAKRSGEPFDRLNSPELRALRQNRRIGKAGPILQVDTRNIRFLTNEVYVNPQMGVPHPDLLAKLPKEYVEDIRESMYGYYTLRMNPSLGERMWEVLEDMEKQGLVTAIRQRTFGETLEFD